MYFDKYHYNDDHVTLYKVTSCTLSVSTMLCVKYIQYKCWKDRIFKQKWKSLV